LSNDVDADGDTLLIKNINTTGTLGTVENNTSNLSYTPPIDTLGFDSFTYVASDGNGGLSASTTVTISIDQIEVTFDTTTYLIEHSGLIQATNASANTDDTSRQKVNVTVTSVTDTTGIEVELTETTINSGVFASTQFLIFSTQSSNETLTRIQTAAGETVTVTYGLGASDTASIVSSTSELPTQGIAIDTLFNLACVSDGDDDGICDEWENALGILDEEEEEFLYEFICGPGTADPVSPTSGTPDIYVEIDYMTGHRPSATAIAEVVSAFAAPKPSSSDANVRDGIQLHVIVDEDIQSHTTEISMTSNVGASDFDTIKSAKFGTSDERAAGALTLELKRQFYHYMLIAHQRTGDTGSSGYAEQAGNDVLITLGAFSGGIGTVDELAGTIMHELGHNLDLRHGGPNIANNQNFE